jgi:hypothetical protein
MSPFRKRPNPISVYHISSYIRLGFRQSSSRSYIHPKPPKMPPSTPAATIVSLDHLVLTVKSIPASKDWYTQYLGMRHEVFVSGCAERHALIFGNSKINLHEAGKVCPRLMKLSTIYCTQSSRGFQSHDFHL